MKRKTTIAPAELPILLHVAERSPISVGKVAKHFAETTGLARTTVLTVMERLRQKGFLTRKKVSDVYQYSPRSPGTTVLRDLVRDFVEKALGGSLNPFIAYLTEEAQLNEAQVAELTQLVDLLQARRKGPGL